MLYSVFSMLQPHVQPTPFTAWYFSIIFYKDLDQVVRLLRAIYRPQNYYCLHLDKKAPAELHDTVRSLARCFENVYVPLIVVFRTSINIDLSCPFRFDECITKNWNIKYIESTQYVAKGHWRRQVGSCLRFPLSAIEFENDDTIHSSSFMPYFSQTVYIQKSQYFIYLLNFFAVGSEKCPKVTSDFLAMQPLNYI